MSSSYEDGDEITMESAEQPFDEMVAEKKWFRVLYPEMEKPGTLENIKDVICNEIEKLEDGNGKLRDCLKLYMAVRRRVE